MKADRGLSVACGGSPYFLSFRPSRGLEAEKVDSVGSEYGLRPLLLPKERTHVARGVAARRGEDALSVAILMFDLPKSDSFS